MSRSKYRKCVRCKQNRALGRYVGTRGRICDRCRKLGKRTFSKDAYLQATYGITLDEWHELLAHQDGVCGACGESRRNNRYDVDHDHSVERALLASGLSAPMAARQSVRGLLCRRCNKVLAQVRDNVDVLLGLVNYLDMWPAGEFLK